MLVVDVVVVVSDVVVVTDVVAIQSRMMLINTCCPSDFTRCSCGGSCCGYKSVKFHMSVYNVLFVLLVDDVLVVDVDAIEESDEFDTRVLK